MLPDIPILREEIEDEIVTSAMLWVPVKLAPKGSITTPPLPENAVAPPKVGLVLEPNSPPTSCPTERVVEPPEFSVVNSSPDTCSPDSLMLPVAVTVDVAQPITS